MILDLITNEAIRPIKSERESKVMSTNGRQAWSQSSNRRLRFDELGPRSQEVERSPSLAGISHSGRRLIVAAAAVLLGLVGLLSVAFVQWRADYKARVSFGLAQVVIVIDEFGEIRPPDTDAQTWREAIIETHAMLASLVSSNLMNRPQMEAFRNELSATAARARAHPETARAELASVWNAVAQRAPFLLQDGPSGRRKGHRRPALLPPLPQRDKSSAR